MKSIGYKVKVLANYGRWSKVIIISFLLSPSSFDLLFTQDFSQILSSIEQQSLLLTSARQEAEAQKADAKVESSLDPLSVGFNYLFGLDDIGSRRDFNVSQTFDFPTAQVQRHKLARELQRVADLQYLSERQKTLIAARKLCIEVVYCNAMMEHLNEDLEETQAMADAYQKLFERGEATIIDHNKAHQALLFFMAEYRAFVAMKENLLAELKCLNGGIEVQINDTSYVHEPVPADFDTWLAQRVESHPDLMLAEGQLSASQHSLRAARHQWAPGLTVGYMAELAREDRYHGPTIGLSLPLWSNGRKVRSARLHMQAAETALQETSLHLRTQYQSIYRDLLQLQETCSVYAHHLSEHDNAALLQKSLDAGQITLITYLQERQYLHEMHVKHLEAERDLELRRAEAMVY